MSSRMRREGTAKAMDWGSGTIDWSGCDEVEVVPGKLSGMPILKNTRFPADSILDHFVNGHIVEEILDWFKLDEKQVRIVFYYCALHASERHPVASEAPGP